MRETYVVAVDGMEIPFRDIYAAWRYVAKNGGIITKQWR